MVNQPQATDFTEIVASVTQDGEYAVRVLLDSGQHIVVSKWVCREEAERLELAINQTMIEYRTKRNAWNPRRIVDPERQCDNSPSSEHEPDWESLARADCESVVFNVKCRYCDRIATTDVADVDWNW